MGRVRPSHDRGSDRRHDQTHPRSRRPSAYWAWASWAPARENSSPKACSRWKWRLSPRILLSPFTRIPRFRRRSWNQPKFSSVPAPTSTGQRKVSRDVGASAPLVRQRTTSTSVRTYVIVATDDSSRERCTLTPHERDARAYITIWDHVSSAETSARAASSVWELFWRSPGRPRPTRLLPGQQSTTGKATASTNGAAGDPLGRNTPSGTLYGFLQAAQSGNYSIAAQYLQMSAARRQTQGEDLASKLKVVIDRSFSGDLRRISNQPEGTPQEGMPLDRQRVGNLNSGDVDADLVLVRVTDADGARIWLISSDTLAKVPELYEQAAVHQVETRLPQVLVRNEFLGLPLWQWLAILLADSGRGDPGMAGGPDLEAALVHHGRDIASTPWPERGIRLCGRSGSCSRHSDPRDSGGLHSDSRAAKASLPADSRRSGGDRVQLAAVAVFARSDAERPAARRPLGADGNRFAHDSGRTRTQGRDLCSGDFPRTRHSWLQPHHASRRTGHRRYCHRLRCAEDAGESVRRRFAFSATK